MGEEAHLLDRHVEPLDDELGKARLVALALRARADHDVDVTVGLHRHLGALARDAGRGVEIIGDGDAAQLAAGAGVGAARGKAVPVAHAQHPLQGVVIVAAVVDHAEGVGVGKLVAPHEIAAADLDAIEAVLAAGEVDQPLHDVHHLGAAGAAIGPRRRGVAHHRAAAEMRGRDAVDRRHDLDALLQRRVVGGVGAGIADVGAAHGEEIALGVERELGSDREIARLVVAQERLVPLARPFHRHLQPPRRPGDERELRIDHAAGAEIAADLAHDDAHLVRRHRENGGEIVLEPPHAAAAGIKRDAARLGVEFGDRGARLHRHAGDALDPGVELHHMRGARERGLRRRGVAELAVDHDVGAGLLEQQRRVGIGGLAGVGHRGQHLVVDLDAFGAVLGGTDALCHHHRHRLADEAHLVGGQRVMRRGEGLEVAPRREHHLGGMLRPHLVGDRLQSVGNEIAAGEHGEHAGHRQRRRRVDAADARMRVRRAHHDGIGLAGQAHVIGIVALAGDEAQVLAPANRLPDAGARRLFGHLMLNSRIAVLPAMPARSSSLRISALTMFIGSKSPIGNG